MGLAKAAATDSLILLDEQEEKDEHSG